MEIKPSTLKRIERLLKKGYSDTLEEYVNRVLLIAIKEHELRHQKAKKKNG